MFLDRVKIWVRAGDGGDGASTFRQEAHVPRGGPDGGDGGRGGSVYLEVDAGQTTLRDFQHKRHFKATPGGRGERARRHGKAGDDLSSTSRPAPASIDDETGELLADLVAVGQRAMVARGGRGGLGNTHFKTSTHQAPKHAQKGEPGAEGWLRLELRLIADIGLVGLPNAGKSTLLAALTAAQPKIADYPFTTLEPNLGVMDFGDEDERRPTIADVPGLIEGASLGAGLGHAFLRHVERTRILVHVVDGAARDPEWDHEVIRDELRAHDPALLEKPILIAFNKLDLPAAREAWPAFERARAKEGLDGRRPLGGHRRGPAGVPSQARRAPPRCGRAGRAARARGRGRPSDRGDGRRVPRRDRRGRGLPGPRRPDRTDRRPDQLRRRGVGGTLPARPRPAGHRRRAATGGDHSRAISSGSAPAELEWEAQPWEA